MKKNILVLLAIFIGLTHFINAQTNPTPQTLPYSQDFSTLASTATAYPVGWQGWTIGVVGPVAFTTTAPTADRALIANSTAATNSGNVHNYNGTIGFLNSTSLDLSVVFSVNTTGNSNVNVSYDVMTIRNPYDGTTNTRINEVTLQYRVGNTGVFTNLTGIEYQNNTTTQTTTGVTTPQNLQNKTIVLPTACDNQAEVQLRWASRQVSGGGGRPSFAFDNISVTNGIASNAAEILTFDIPSQVSSTVNSLAGTVNIVMPFGTDVTTLVPTITLSAGATIIPNSGTTQNFTSSVTFVVTAQDAITTKNWTVNVTVQPGSNAAEIISFDIPTQLSSTVNSLAATVNIIMPLGTTLNALIPTIILSTGATVSPLSGVAQDFTGAVSYTVTAQDGSTTKIWTINVGIQANNQAEILTFDIPTQVSSTINGLATTVNIVMPFGTNVTTLIPTITLSTGATVSPLTGVAQDFTSNVAYTVTAQDAVTTKTWTVNVTVQPGSTAAEIITFDIAGQTSSVVNTGTSTVNIVMPSGTIVTNLTPTITISANATISPNNGISQDFTLPVNYIVTAQDGITTKNWTVNVTVDLATIVLWNFPNNPDDSIADGGIAANLNKLLITNSSGVVAFASAGVTTNSARNTGWASGMDTKYWEIEFTTAGFSDITLASILRSSSTGPKDFKVQYKIGTGGTWTDVPAAIITTAANWTTGVLPTMTLPIETFNKTSVFLRWIMTSDIAVGGAAVVAAGASNIDNIIIKGIPLLVNNAAEILTCDIPTQVSSVVNSTNATVSIIMPYGTVLTSLIPTITYSTGATIAPLSGIAQDFTLPVNYLVTAQDGITTKNWTVTVTLAPAPSNAAEIITFDIPTQVSSTITSASSTIDILLPIGTNVTALTPSITVSAGATISPLTGVVQDFTNPVTYIVTAEDGVTSKTWTATVSLVIAPLAIVEWNFPNNPDDSIADGGITANLTKGLASNTGNLATYIPSSAAGATTSSARASAWDSGLDTKYWVIEFTTNGYEQITLSSRQRSSSTGPANFKAQYKVGTAGTWTDITNGTITVANDFTTGILTDLSLPIECNNQSSVFIRWIMTSDIAVSGAAVAITGASGIDDIIVKGLLITNTNEVDLNISFSVSLYPNPATEYVNLISNNNSNSDLNIELISIDGKVLLKEKLQNNIISLKGISDGIYFIKVISDGKVNIQKLVVN